MKKTYEYMIKTTGEPYGKKVRAGNCFLALSPGAVPLASVFCPLGAFSGKGSLAGKTPFFSLTCAKRIP